ncbi:MAG: glycoside hydrolase family 20 zincin-like fold domain-containing protein [Tannerellaceae bacterium]|nr:glycoside hydrolase family 20 zincin-like fold domain-containing protein [Tannerellaceae bacterium]
MDKPVIITGDEALTDEISKLQQILAGDYSIMTETVYNQAGNIRLVLDATLLPDQPEGYQLEVTARQITLCANQPAGISHGIQSLRQMITENKGIYQIQSGTITDYPAFPWRALCWMKDVTSKAKR